MSWLGWGLVAGGLGFGWYALKFYDTGRLTGLAQMRAGPAQALPGSPDDEPLRLDGPHRWIRHPLYLAAFLILWGRAMDPLGLATAVWGSAYLLIGTAMEERRLIALYGDSYRDYRARVPAYLPWKGRVL